MGGLTWQTVYYAVSTFALIGGIALTLLSGRLKKDFIDRGEFKTAMDKIAAEITKSIDPVEAELTRLGAGMRREVDDVKSRQERQHDRLTNVEAIVQHMPTEKAFNSLAIAMERLSGELHVSIERISSVKEGLDRVENTLSRHEDILSTAARVQ